MRFGAAFWIQRTDWPDLRDTCVAAERAGWDTIWLDDHLLSDEASPDDPKLEGWASLHAVAGILSTKRIRTTDLMLLKPYFHGTTSRNGAPF